MTDRVALRAITQEDRVVGCRRVLRHCNFRLMKTRRGQGGWVRSGRIPGGRIRGSEVVSGGKEHGQRMINQAEAQIIFLEHVDARLGLVVAGRVNLERICAAGSRAECRYHQWQVGSGATALQ